MNSVYAKAVFCKRRRKVLSFLIDIAVLFILNIILFAVSDAILGSTASYKTTQDVARTAQNELFSIVEESSLAEYENGALTSTESVSSSLIKGKTYNGVLKYKDRTEISANLYSGVEPVTEDNDFLYQYLVFFKEEKKQQYKEDSRKESGLEYYYESLREISVYLDFSSSYPEFTSAAVLALDEYYMNSSYEQGRTIYENLLAFYSEKNLSCRRDLIDNYLPYQEKEANFNSASLSLMEWRGIALFVSYIFSSAALLLVVPLVLKNGRTIGNKILSLANVRRDKEECKVLNVVIKYLLSFVSMGIVPFLVLFIFFSVEAVYFMNIYLFSFFNFFIFALLSLIYLLVSFLFDFIRRNEVHQTLTEFLSMIYLKDTREFVTEEEND